MSETMFIHHLLEGENPLRWLEPRVTNIGITLTNIKVYPNDGVKTEFSLEICPSIKQIRRNY